MQNNRSNLVIKDTDALIKDHRRKQLEKHLEEKKLWAKNTLQHCVFLRNENENPANIPQQLGNIMTGKELETKLKKLIPNLVFEYNPINPLMKALYVIRDNKKEYICSYHADMMPEHSIMKVKKEVVWDEDYDQPLKRSELPTHKWVKGKGYVFEGIPPGWKEVEIPWGEIKRGWRTVLLKLVKEGLLTVTQAEKFGTPTSQFGKRAWSYHLGKQTDSSIQIPF